ncbi:MAG: CDP-alcohol phosphatidyltransferase family protein [Planctomycetes bacterium]|nr:CDP-alcohol phosphatidyltransferase family protein [Planctomycetota bacterium]
MKKVWVLPTLLTLANGFFGFLALAKCLDASRLGAASPEFGGKLEYASICVLLAMLCDCLDGWVARRLNSSTDFGGQLDSLCDAVSFGIVPGVIFKTFMESGSVAPSTMLSRYWLAAGGCYACCALLRLARFNVENSLGREDHKAFRGLPSPGAAFVVVAAVLFYYDERLDQTDTFLTHLPWLRDFAIVVRSSVVVIMPFLMFGLGAAMVSRLAYPHFGSQLFSKKFTVGRIARGVVVLALAALEPRLVFFLASLLFGFYGPVYTVIKRIRGRIPRPRQN